LSRRFQCSCCLLEAVKPTEEEDKVSPEYYMCLGDFVTNVYQNSLLPERLRSSRYPVPEWRKKLRVAVHDKFSELISKCEVRDLLTSRD
jgi:hypothetical protein